MEYIKDSRLTELQKALQFDIVFVIIAVDDRDAISQAADVLDDYGKTVQWLVVKNYRDSTELKMFDESETRQRLLGFGAIEVEVPCLSEITKNRLQMLNLTVGKGRSNEKLHLLDPVSYTHLTIMTWLAIFRCNC